MLDFIIPCQSKFVWGCFYGTFLWEGDIVA